MSIKANILLLQGPVGVFFKHLSQQLDESQFDVRHVCFNASDIWYSDVKYRHIFQGTDDVWINYLDQLNDNKPIDLIILFGCERSRHAMAIEYGKIHNIPILSLEEGYLRPGYITAEWGGNNRKSPLRNIDLNTPIDYLNIEPASGHAFKNMSWYSFKYYMIRHFGKIIYPGAGHHKQRDLIKEAFFWCRNVLRKNLHRRYNHMMFNKMSSLDGIANKYFIVPMQVRDDGQLLKAGNGWNNEKVREHLIPSFAKHSNPEDYLIFKAHPLERGHTNAKQHIKELSKKHNVSDRVIYIDDGSIGQITKYAKCMITINSTSAISAFHFGTPLIVLGEAMFKRDELVTCVNDMNIPDTIWKENHKKDKNNIDIFFNLMKETALLSGDFYSKTNINIAIKEIIKKVNFAIDNKF